MAALMHLSALSEWTPSNRVLKSTGCIFPAQCLVIARVTSGPGDNVVTVEHPEKNKAFTSEHRPASSCHFPPLIQFASGNLIGHTRKTAHLQKLQRLTGTNYARGRIYERADAL